MSLLEENAIGSVIVVTPLLSLSLFLSLSSPPPLFNITRSENSTTDVFVFTLPIDSKLYTELGTISDEHGDCDKQELSCEWQDPTSLQFLQSGCAVSRSMVDMGSGVVGTECTCSHLTVFAIALRTKQQLSPLCHASEVDYVLLALYAALSVCLLVVQLPRIYVYKLPKVSMAQHSLLLLASVLRIALLVAKPVIGSLAGLVMLGLLPSAIALILFIYLMLTWTSLQLTTTSLSGSPFARFRIPFAIVAISVAAIMIAIVIAIAIVPPTRQEDEPAAATPTTRRDVVVSGSYVLAALYAVVCFLVLLAGFGLRKSLGELILASSGASASSGSSSSSSPSGAATTTNWRAVFRWRVLVATVGLSSCLFVSACLWVAAVQTDIIVSDAATLATTTTFYVFDWLGLCLLTWLLSSAISTAAKKRQWQQDKSKEDLSMSER